MGPADTYSERDLEAAILQELERFFLEPGTDFSFIARQKSMTIGERRRPLGLPCAAKENREQIELVQLDRSDIRVMEYLVELPPREMLEAKLHEAIWLARGQVQRGVKELKGWPSLRVKACW